MKRLNSKLLSSLLLFIDLHWKKNHIFVREPRLFNYIYKKKNNEYNFFIRDRGQEIVAIIGVIQPSTRSIWLTTWRSVGNENQGVLLFNEVINKFNTDFIGSIGINRRIEKFYKMIGWKTISLNHYYLRKTVSQTSLKTKYVYTNSPRLDQFYKDNYLPYKNEDYITRRYISNPYFNYRFLIVDSMEILFVGRVVEYNNIKVFHCVDFFGKIDNKVIRSVIVKFLHDYSFDLFELMCYCSDSPSIDLDLKNDQPIIPTYFNPFLFENIEIRCAYKASKDDRIKIVLGDSDQDRPN